MTSPLLLAVLAAATPPTAAAPAALRAELAGVWTGALGYRDYQSDKLVELPVRTTIVAVPDGVTLVRTSAFDDGPKAGTVWITTLEIVDAKAAAVSSASFRRGSKPELSTERVRVLRYVDPTHWMLVYDETGSDDDTPAEIRVIETRDGSDLRSVKKVRPVGAPEAAWRFRDQSRLTRVSGPP